MEQADAQAKLCPLHIYRPVSANAFCFIIEVAGQPVGECWLQKMNIPDICLCQNLKTV